MKRLWTYPLWFALVALVSASAVAQKTAAPKKSPAKAPTPRLREKALRAHLDFLAGDLLEGRASGTRGHEIAASYVAAHLQELGLEGVGSKGSFLQSVPLRRIDLDRKKSSIKLQRSQGPLDLRDERDYLLSGDPLREQSALRAGLVYAGFGVTAPELRYDDYASVDVKGKILVLLSGAPEAFPHDARAYYSSALTKLTNAARHGAVGVLTVRTPADETRQSWAGMVRQSSLPSMRWLDAKGAPADVAPEIRATGTLSRRGAEKIFSSSPVSIERLFIEGRAGKPAPFPLPVEAEIRLVTRHTRVESPNVIGVLRGSDPLLRQEAVVYSAHLDHLGIIEGSGDTLYNGAYDNASGVAILLELARLFASQPRPPRRSIVFLFVTGEEKGLVGSDYFARNPPRGVGRVVANINLDAILMLYPNRQVIVHGAEHSTLGSVAEAAARDLELRVVPDPAPAESRFVRSDQYSFVRQGVPAISLKGGTKSGDPAIDGATLNQQWQRGVYHTPQDDLGQKFELSVGVKFGQLAYLIGERVAARNAAPTWKAGDFFAKRFEK